MMAALQDWTLRLCGAALAAGAALALCPSGMPRRVLRLACGLLMAVVLLSPVADLDWGNYAADLAAYRQMAQEAVLRGEEAVSAGSRSIIEQECAAYVWDKAEELGVALEEVTVSAAWSSEGVWYPAEISLRAPAGRSPALAAMIAGDLGIPEDEQKWS